MQNNITVCLGKIFEAGGTHTLDDLVTQCAGAVGYTPSKHTVRLAISAMRKQGWQIVCIRAGRRRGAGKYYAMAKAQTC
jgi:DNA-binding transcriptional regulator PaaX